MLNLPVFQNARSMCRPKREVLFTLAGILAYGATAGAVPTIDFNITMTSGLVAYDGAGGPLNGVVIQVNSVTGTDTSNDGTFACVDCFFNFQTEDFTMGGPNFWVFGNDSASSFLSISGDIDTDGDSIGDLPLLMLGDFVGAQLAVDLLAVDPFDFGIAAGVYLASHNVEFTNFFGVSSDSAGGMLLAWVGFAEPPGALFSTVGVGLVQSVFEVAEPGTTLLIAGAFLAMAGKAGLRKRPRRQR